jgi:3-hydroxyethyl bacteriochlorophyllide a dehydrogenase
MSSTQAIVIPAAQRVELRAVELTEPAPGDVIVRTAYTSISAGTERMLLAGRMPHPMLSFPVIPGYETVGRVVGLGPEAPPELEGSWVYVGGARCFSGVNPAWGGQAATLIVDHRRVVPLDGVEPRAGVLMALAATALHGVELLGELRGQRLLVLGQGPVGQLAARIARGRGAWVAAVEREAGRLERSRADLRLHGDGPLTGEALGGPVAAIVEATGSMEALAGALPLLADGGTVLLLGYYDELRLPYMPLFLKQARLLTAREWAPGDLARCRDLLAAGELDAAGLLTHAMPVEQAAAAYEVALNDPSCLKLVLEWGDERDAPRPSRQLGGP